MIYTMTLNPSFDYKIEVDNLCLGKTNRTINEVLTVGGKGINVSYVLKELECESINLGFVAGFMGAQLRAFLHDAWHLHENFIVLNEGMTRINVKLKSKSETEINGRGPVICEDAFMRLKQQLMALRVGDVLVLSGSIPPGLLDDTYATMMQWVPQGVKVIVDACGAALRKTLPHHPWLIKPNLDELESFFSTTIQSVEQLKHYLTQLQNLGAQYVLVSLGKDGAVLLDPEGVFYYQKACDGTLVDSVGAGDSMVAGFIAGLLQNKDAVECLMLATACGGATAFSDHLAKSQEIDALTSLLKDSYRIL